MMQFLSVVKMERRKKKKVNYNDAIPWHDKNEREARRRHTIKKLLIRVDTLWILKVSKSTLFDH
jgi:hypothetical protein